MSRILMSFFIAILVSGCMSPKGATLADKRQSVQTMRVNTLNDLYKINPYAKNKINQANGHAVFSNLGFNLLWLSTASGWGVVKGYKGGKDVYMNMYSAGVGLGLGVKDFRGVFVFSSKDALNQFVEEGWDAGVQADAVAKSDDKGDGWGGAIAVAPGVHLYQITRQGLALQATIQGTKFWKDSDLN
ncbi:hypothetical protein A9Q83_07600 [Alphaproteobacteria bacterium 46_93_T64]|nr:hypothetical protein A9Q83_07600 [Alphaproteobacteria bacterium 46_93_T64]